MKAKALNTRACPNLGVCFTPRQSEHFQSRDAFPPSLPVYTIHDISVFLAQVPPKEAVSFACSLPFLGAASLTASPPPSAEVQRPPSHRDQGGAGGQRHPAGQRPLHGGEHRPRVLLADQLGGGEAHFRHMSFPQQRDDTHRSPGAFSSCGCLLPEVASLVMIVVS